MPGLFSHGSIHELNRTTWSLSFLGHKSQIRLWPFREALLLQIYTLIWSLQSHDMCHLWSARNSYSSPLIIFNGEGNGTPLQYSCLQNPMDGGAWWAAVHGVAKSRTRLSDFTFTFTHWRRKWQPTPVFLPWESQGWGSLVSCRLWGRTKSDMTEMT